jgi:hypothetical protein
VINIFVVQNRLITGEQLPAVGVLQQFFEFLELRSSLLTEDMVMVMKIAKMTVSGKQKIQIVHCACTRVATYSTSSSTRAIAMRRSMR